MVEVEVSPSLERGQSLALSVRGHHAIEETGHVRILLFDLGEIETSWRMSPGSLEVARPASGVISVAVDTASDLPAGLYEVRRVDLARGDVTLSVLQGGRDFARTFFEVREAGEPERSASEVAQAASERETKREVVLSQPLGHPAASGAQEFRVLSLVERCLVTRRFRFPGFEFMPLQSEGLGGDVVSVINQFLAINGWTTRIPAEQWVTEEASRRPFVAFFFPRVFASTADHAGQIVHRVRDRVLDLLAVHRGSSGAPLVSLVEKLLDAGKGLYGEGGWLPEAPAYTGNLATGFIAGESPVTIFTHLRATESDPLLALWASLFRDARAEPEADFAFFRYWNLLETMATNRVQPGQPATDLGGAPLMLGNKPATTDAAQGKVYELLKRTLLRENMNEQIFVSKHPNSDLWAETTVWYGLRNAAGHHGGFRMGDPAQQRQWWYQPVLDAYQAVSGPTSFLDSLPNPYLRDLREAAERVLHSELSLVGRSLPPLL